MEKTNILLVEDDLNLSSVLTDYLEMLGYNITHADNGLDGLSKFKQGDYHLCILDIMLPRMDGFTLGGEIRKLNQAVPMVFLTARNQDVDRIRGFKVGADDYITKPFSSEELELRIQAILKRYNYKQIDNDVFEFGNSSFNAKNMILTCCGKEHKLTRKEAALMKLLCLHQNQILTRETALQQVWGNSDYFVGRSMDVFITKLRKYLADDPKVNIQNIHGTGFRLEVTNGDTDGNQ